MNTKIPIETDLRFSSIEVVAERQDDGGVVIHLFEQMGSIHSSLGMKTKLTPKGLRELLDLDA